MKSFTTERFRKGFRNLPVDVQRQARDSYRLFKEDPFHPSLHFKQIRVTEPIYSVRVGRSYRAIGVKHGEEVVWFWIGSHSDYDKLVGK
jgi:hypothetical protein